MGCNHWMICQRLKVFKLKIETNTLQGDVKAEIILSSPSQIIESDLMLKPYSPFLKIETTIQ